MLANPVQKEKRARYNPEIKTGQGKVLSKGSR